MSDSGDSFPSIMKGIFYIAFLVFLIFRGSCVENDVAVRAMNNSGFTDVKITDRSNTFAGFRGCDVQDAATFEVIAVNTRDKPVRMLVCTGWPFKGATIRSP